MTASLVATEQRARLHLRVRGIVQGVGFRPFVYGLAARWALAGHVGNDADGVFIEVEGVDVALAQFQHALTADAPPLSHIESVAVTTIEATGQNTFTILDSQAGATVRAHIPPDVGLCADCLRELFDPADRRYRYPFINCTHCGPRFTLIRGIPYDRATTTMAGFAMCPACAAEYHDPRSRRFHAQPIACPTCGPHLWYTTAEGRNEVRGDEAALEAARAALRAGAIIAVKGVGGFHLACEATNDEAIARLRERKGRVDKPFAVMACDLAAVRAFAHVDAAEAALLTSPQRPILLLRKRADAGGLSAGVAPGNPYVGVMLPYTPLHHLLLDGTPLVMTSGNLSGEPICIGNEEAQARLTPLVDAFLFHDRPIHTPCDDSVLRVHGGGELPIRRSRGYTPYPIKLPTPGPSVLATGGELKNTFCLAHDGYAFLSQHIGDMENVETLDAFERAQAHLTALYRATPQAIVCDLHPGYLTTRWAEAHAAQSGLPLVRVQHHHAHIAAVMAEHALGAEQRVIGICLDGTGYGMDGTIWGGEVLVADYTSFERIAYLNPVPLPGGDAAIKRPYRMALANLWAAGLDWDDDLPPVAACTPAERRILSRQFEMGINSVPTSSMGRLFDAVAALLGVRQTVSYEAQAAIELEGLTDLTARGAYPFEIITNPNGALVIDPAPMLGALVADMRARTNVGAMAWRFHAGVANVLTQVCLRLRKAERGSVVALSGGVFQNIRLLEALTQRLQGAGFTVLTHCRVPPNDGGLALGQAVIGMNARQP
jgi:hydrogenase maturation protein HypF